MLTFGELFAGIGGFSLGLERAGMKCKWQVEIEPYARAVLKKHWPEVPKHDDVRTFPPQGDYSVDLICGGFPCQDISLAGKGAGLSGARSGLWYEFARIIGGIRPRYVVVENVAALATRGLDAVVGTLSTLGYDAEWHVIPACAVGAPHRRERLWIVGVCCRDGAKANASRSDADCVGSHRAEVNVFRGSQFRDEQDGIAGSVGAHVADADGRRLEVKREPEHGVEQGSCGSETDGCGEGRRRSRADVSHADCAGRQQQRRAEPTQAEQLAAECGGWWESEPDVGRVAHGVPSRVDRLRCLGNAVVPQVVEVIGRAIVEHEKNRTASGMRP